MAIVGGRLPTLLDTYLNPPTPGVSEIAEVLLQSNSMLPDIPMAPYNNGKNHIANYRSNLGKVYHRKANQAIPSSAKKFTQRTWTATDFEARTQIDEKVAEQGGLGMVSYNRQKQSEGDIQAMGNHWQESLIYGSSDELGSQGSTQGQEMYGLTDYYFTSNASTAEVGRNVIDIGKSAVSTATHTSIYLIYWSPNSIYGIHPPGMPTGIRREDRTPGTTNKLPIQGLNPDGTTGTFYGYDESIKVDFGFVVEDYRQGGRISGIQTATATGIVREARTFNTLPTYDIINAMIDIQYRIHNKSMGYGVWYCNKSVLSALHKQAISGVTAGGGITFENYGGMPVMYFGGMPIKQCDAIMNTETKVA